MMSCQYLAKVFGDFKSCRLAQIKYIWLSARWVQVRTHEMHDEASNSFGLFLRKVGERGTFWGN